MTEETNRLYSMNGGSPIKTWFISTSTPLPCQKDLAEKNQSRDAHHENKIKILGSTNTAPRFHELENGILPTNMWCTSIYLLNFEPIPHIKQKAVKFNAGLCFTNLNIPSRPESWTFQNTILFQNVNPIGLSVIFQCNMYTSCYYIRKMCSQRLYCGYDWHVSERPWP